MVEHATRAAVLAHAVGELRAAVLQANERAAQQAQALATAEAARVAEQSRGDALDQTVRGATPRIKERE